MAKFPSRKTAAINKEIAEVFLKKAEKYEQEGKNRYRIISLRKAAATLMDLETGVDEIYKKSWLVGLEKIDGIGNRLAHAIEQELQKKNK